MRIQLWGVVSLLVLVVGCSKPKGDCWGQTCSAAERCDDMERDCLPDLPPVLTLVAPTGVVSTPTFVITGSATDDGAVTSAEWKSGSSEWTTIPLNPDGTFSIAVPAPLLDAQNIVVSARISDALVKVSAEVQVVVDRVGPVFELLSPTSASQSAPTFTVKIRATDGSGSLSSLVIDGTSVTMPMSGSEVSRTFDVPPNANHTPLAVAVSASDARANTTSQTFTFFGDRVPPAITFVTPTPMQVVSGEALNAEVSVFEPGTVSSVVFTANGTDYPASQVAGGHWVAAIPLAAGVDADLVVVAKATDDAGNFSTAMVTAHVDRLAPTVAISAPTAGGLFRSNIAVSAVTSGQTTSVSVVLDGQTTPMTGSGGSWTASVAVPQRDFSTLPLQVRARDAVGNESVAQVSIAVDTVAPVISFTAPSAGQKFKASDFATSTSVVSTWTVSDADPQAGTTTVNSVASTATTVALPTSPNDDPMTYTNTVVATDRAGNSTTAAISYSVDRVAPTVISWTPSANTRNLEPRESVITFSEVVNGPTSTSPALMVVADAQSSTVGWYLNHTQYKVSLDYRRGRVVELSVAPDLADSHGNQIVSFPPNRKIHIAGGLPDGALIATNATDLVVAADSDGAVTIAYSDSSGLLHVLTEVGGSLTSVSLTQTAASSMKLNSVNVVDPLTLRSESRFALSLPGANYTYSSSAGLVALSLPSDTLVVSQPPLRGESVPDLFATLRGSSYARGTLSRNLFLLDAADVAQSSDSLIATSKGNPYFSWSRYRCNKDSNGATFTCGGVLYQFQNPAGTPSFVQSRAAMTRDGACALVRFNSDTTEAAAMQPLSNCDAQSSVPSMCSGGVYFTASQVPRGIVAAPFSRPSEESLILAWPAGTTFAMYRNLSSDCTGSTLSQAVLAQPALALPFTPSFPEKFGVAQTGNHSGLFYLTTTGEIRVHVE